MHGIQEKVHFVNFQVIATAHVLYHKPQTKSGQNQRMTMNQNSRPVKMVRVKTTGPANLEMINFPIHSIFF